MSDADRLAAARAHQAAPGTVASLYGAFAARLEVVAARYWGLSTKGEDRRAATVLPGWLAPKTPESEQFPFILVRPRSGEDTAQGADERATAQVRLVIGTYSDTDDGWFDVLSLIDAVRDDLNAAPAIDGTAYEHIGPLTWEIPDDQARPQWFGYVTTNWQLPRAQRVDALNP